MSAKYTRIDSGAGGSLGRPELGHGDSQISLELESLASSDEGSIRSVSSRGLSPLDSPIRSPEIRDDDNDPMSYGMQFHGRSMSVSTMGEHMINLPSTNDPFLGETAVPLEKQKRLTLFHGLSLVIGLQIGSGIFASPNQINSNAGSVGMSLIIWVAGGLLAWTGASSYAELGSAIPLNGSSQAYLNQIYGSLPSFLFSWTALTILKPGSTAIIAIIFSEYFCRALGSSPVFTNYWFQKFIAIIGLAIVVAINCFSTRLGARAGNFFLVIKIGVLLAITIIGIVASFHFHDTNALTGADSRGLFADSSKSIGNYAIALYAGLWAYDGWDNVNYVSAEMKNPRRDLPRVIHIAMPVVIVAYFLANIAYYAVMSEEEIEKTTSVAITFATKTMGPVAGIIFAILISLSCIGALNATIFSSARLVYSSAEEGFLPSMFCKLHPVRSTPVNALLLQSAIACIFILVGEFHSLLTFYGFAGYSFYFLTVSGVIVLRIREPDLDRPYKTYISTPILFCCVALFLVSRTLFEKPIESLFVALFIASGLPIYIWRFGLLSQASVPSFDDILRKLKIRR
ncbi:Mup1p [Sugiyamaella lignohabitans]|uniref:Mup1p n=1 Tax=Sugiyamaella lignohabitans TaxID=796027 RepID=A0A167C110_9ASCO|nr:Mup1p [Sugiyamaella lignohabitans]ANB11084.1 Mup1p [Sugiyamaella lignohabitans]